MKICTNSLAHKLKIKPHAERIREQMLAIPLPGIAQIDFGSTNWRPSNRFYHYAGTGMGRTFAVRKHGTNTFVARVA